MRSLKKILSVTLTLVLALAVAVTLAGCGSSETLESYVTDNEEAQETIDSLVEASSSDIGKMTAEVEGNTVTYTYTFNDTLDDEAAKETSKQLESNMDSMGSAFGTISSELTDQSGIDDITIKLVYVDASGTELYSNEY